MGCCSQKQKLISLFVVGLLVLAIGCACIPFFKWFIRDQIKKSVILVEGSQTYQNFLQPVPEIYMQYYVFHVENPVEISKGTKKPSVKQRGPYTYREYRKKINVVHNKNGTITYEQLKSYKFVPEKSVGNDTDTFTTLNLVLLTVANAMRNEPEIVQQLVSLVLKFQEEPLFVNKTVYDMVWGYHDPLLNVSSVFAPKWFSTDLVGTMAGKNDTTDGIYTVFTGANNISQLGSIDRYNGSRYLPYWTSDQANMVNGTDGTLCPPFLTKDAVLYTFSTDVCRSVYGVYSGEVSSPQGITLWRFSGTPAVFASASENPANEGFCVPKGNCLGSGIISISTCQHEDGFPLPVYISQPHFYQANTSYINAVNGMHPDPVQHRTEIDIQPDTGIVMKAFKRLQINTYLEPFEYMSPLSDVKRVYFPILYVNESVVIDDKDANMYKSKVAVPILISQIAQYALIAIGVLLLVVSLGYAIYISQNKSTPSTSVNESQAGGPDENTPLLKDASS